MAISRIDSGSARAGTGPGWWAAGAAVAVLAVAGLGGVLFGGQRLNPADDCPAAGLPPAGAELVFDTTDNLMPDQMDYAQALVDRALSSLPRGGRVSVASITGAETTEANVLFNRCRPGLGDNRERNRFRDRVLAPVRRTMGDLAAAPAAPLSPIAETVVAVVKDPRLATAAPPDLYLVTDAMQHSAYADVYAGKPFPAPAGRSLAHVRVHLLLLRNGRDHARQAAAAEALVAWMGQAGAEVDYTPPAWLSLETKETAR